MKTSQPPVLATALLERFVSREYREALAGDLVEQYQQRRSAAWYWRQVLLGIVVGVAKDVGSHKLLALRWAATGLAVYLLSSIPVNLAVRWLIMRGWMIVGMGVLVYMACALIGWVAFRAHRAYSFTVVCVYGFSVLLFEAAHVGLGLLLDGGRPQMTSQMLGIMLLMTASRPLSIVAGGVLGAIGRGHDQ